MATPTPYNVPFSQEVEISPHGSSSSSSIVLRGFLECVLLIATLTLCFLLTVVILSRERLRHNPFCQLVASLSAAGVLFSVLVRPGSIQEGIHNYELHEGYCGLYLFLQRVEIVVLSYSLWMMSIERILALRHPEKYAGLMRPVVARVFLVGTPWLWGLVLGVLLTFVLAEDVLTRYGPYPDDPYFDEYAHFAHVGCVVLYSPANAHAASIVWVVAGTLLPMLALAVSGLTLLIVYCRRRGVKVTVADEGAALVPGASVALTLVLSCLMLLILVEELVGLALELDVYVDEAVVIQWVCCVLELLLAVLGLVVLPDVRRVLGEICSCCPSGDDDEKVSLLQVTARGTQTSTDEGSAQK